MATKTYNISKFLKYLNAKDSKNDSINVVKYDELQNFRLKSETIAVDFYMLGIKSNLDGELNYGRTDYDEGGSFLFLDQPKSRLQWNFNTPFSGYSLLINANLFKKFALEFNFPGYGKREALFLTEEEENLLNDIFEKAYLEYYKKEFSTDILISYARLILSYANIFYQRQFETRRRLYNKVIADFYQNLESYYDLQKEFAELPSVAYFAEKSNHSANYFGDVIKHFTGKSPLEIIHEHLINIAKDKLDDPNLTVSQIADLLGFEYPTYFTRFFKKKTGMTPTLFRNR